MKNQTYRMTMLFDFYGELLTERQREFFDLYYNEDLSLGEIAAEAGISRQGVHDLLTRAAHRLLDMEEKLGMADKFTRRSQGMEQCLAALRAKRYAECETMLDALIRLDQEESNGL